MKVQQAAEWRVAVKGLLKDFHKYQELSRELFEQEFSFATNIFFLMYCIDNLPVIKMFDQIPIEELARMDYARRSPQLSTHICFIFPLLLILLLASSLMIYKEFMNNIAESRQIMVLIIFYHCIYV